MIDVVQILTLLLSSGSVVYLLIKEIIKWRSRRLEREQRKAEAQDAVQIDAAMFIQDFGKAEILQLQKRAEAMGMRMQIMQQEKDNLLEELEHVKLVQEEAQKERDTIRKEFSQVRVDYDACRKELKDVREQLQRTLIELEQEKEANRLLRKELETLKAGN